MGVAGTVSCLQYSISPLYLSNRTSNFSMDHNAESLAARHDRVVSFGPGTRSRSGKCLVIQALRLLPPFLLHGLGCGLRV